MDSVDYPLTFDPQQAANIFHGTATLSFDPQHEVPGTFTLKVESEASTWISVDCEVVGGDKLVITRRYAKGETEGGSVDLAPYVGHQVKILRWAPGFAGLPGDGGGAVYFTMPNVGSLEVNLKVVDAP